MNQISNDLLSNSTCFSLSYVFCTKFVKNYFLVEWSRIFEKDKNLYQEIGKDEKNF